jgi:hypothetical protein
MHTHQNLKLIYFLAFIFDEENDEIVTISIVNYNFTECLNDRVIASQIKKFKSMYNKIHLMSDVDIKLVDERGYDAALKMICESKRKLASSVTDFVEHIGSECVKDQRQRKKFSLNSLMMLQTMLDFFCGLEQSVFDDLYKDNVLSCYKQKSEELEECKKKSFNLVFFDKAPEKLYWIQLVTGKVCK